MDIRKVKKLIELLEESGIDELEIREGEESVRISRHSKTPAQPYYAPAPVAAPAPVSSPAPSFWHRRPLRARQVLEEMSKRYCEWGAILASPAP